MAPVFCPPCSFSAVAQHGKLDTLKLEDGCHPSPCPPWSHATSAAHLPCPVCSFSAVVQDGKLKTLNLEAGGELTCSLSNQILDQLKQ